MCIAHKKDGFTRPGCRSCARATTTYEVAVVKRTTEVLVHGVVPTKNEVNTMRQKEYLALVDGARQLL
jgi:hypothetical protein